MPEYASMFVCMCTYDERQCKKDHFIAERLISVRCWVIFGAARKFVLSMWLNMSAYFSMRHMKNIVHSGLDRGGCLPVKSAKSIENEAVSLLSDFLSQT